MQARLFNLIAIVAGLAGSAAVTACGSSGSAGSSRGAGGAAGSLGAGANSGTGGSTGGTGGTGGSGGIAGGSGGSTGGSGGASGSHIKTVFIILMAKANWSWVLFNNSAPYINNTLLPESSYATQYYNPPNTHPSEPNYIWLEAGSNLGVFDDSSPATNHQSTTQHLARQLKDAGINWKAYEEDISGTTCPLTAVNNYVPQHDPFVFFDDMTGNLSPNDPYCIAHIRPYTELATDLANNSVPRYAFITPNVCDDMQKDCPPLNIGLEQADHWLSVQVPKILASNAYKNNGALFITWDQGDGFDGPIGMIVLSPLAKGGGYISTYHYTHSSTLRTFQEIFGVKPFLRGAASTTDLSDMFTTFP